MAAEAKEVHAVAPETAVIHAGFDPMRSEGSAIVPIILPSTYVFSSAQAGKEAFKKQGKGDRNGELIYARMNHPNAEILEERLVASEPGSGAAAVFSSGMGAISTTMFALLKHGKTLAFTSPVYGGTHHFFLEVLGHKLGFDMLEIDTRDEKTATEQLRALGSKLGVFFIETPANPTLAMVDIDKWATIARGVNPEAVICMDNTFMGVFQRPFIASKDVDVVLYSATKFLGGHSNLLAGVAHVRKEKLSLMPAIRGMRGMIGSILWPFECWQLNTQLATYKLRMEKQCETATEVATFLASHPRVEKVLHPSCLKQGDPDYPIYKKQCTGAGSIISFLLRDADEAKSFKFLDLVNKSHVIMLAVSLGGVESLIEHPASMTHASMTPAELNHTGIYNNLIRFSCGIEDAKDLIASLKVALDNF